MKIIVYHSHLNVIGGCETVVYNLLKGLSKKYDILFLYCGGAKEQINRLSQFVKCEQYNNLKQYKCDLCLCNTSWGGYPDTVTASSGKYWQMIHADYEILKKSGWIYEKWNKTTRHIAVGQHVKETFEKEYQEVADVIYNILNDIQETKPILKLVSATRLSPEKGYTRMVKLAKRLQEAGVRFRWIIFADTKFYQVKPIDMEEVVFMTPRYDFWDYIKEADYGVQLSDTEGNPLFVNECLQYGTAVLVTDFKSAPESVTDGVNGYILDMNLDNLDIDKIVNHIPKNFEYIPKTTIDTWIKEIGKPGKKEKYIPPKIIESIISKDSLEEIRGRGFMTVDNVKTYIASDNFKKLSKLEQEEFTDWFKKLK